MQTNHPARAIDYYKEAGNLRSGEYVVRPLLTGREGAPNNYKCSYGGGDHPGDWTTPRHRHNFEQFRHPIAGDYVINKDEVLPAGWVAYFPESAYYGPQTKSHNLQMITVQFGGPTGQGYWSLEQRKKGYHDLIAKGGRFADGAYTWTDANGRRHNQDGAEAVWEQIFGRKMQYPAPRYRDVIMMNPAAFAWTKDDDAPGVARKILGTFSERRTRVGFIRMEKGATLRFGTEDAPELLFVKEGLLTYGNDTFPRLTAISREAEEPPVLLSAIEPTELWYAKMPTF